MGTTDLYKIGADARRSVGRDTDEELLETVKESPGLTIYELSKLLEWSPGRVHGSLNRLLNKASIRFEYVYKDGRIQKRIFTPDYVEPPAGVLKIDTDLLDEPEIWRSAVYVYALNRTTITLSPLENDGWKNDSVFSTTAPVERHENEFRVQLPQKIIDFYQLPNSQLDIASFDNAILVSVVSTISRVVASKDQVPLVESRILTKEKEIVAEEISEVFNRMELRFIPEYVSTLSEVIATLRERILLQGYGTPPAALAEKITPKQTSSPDVGVIYAKTRNKR